MGVNAPVSDDYQIEAELLDKPQRRVRLSQGTLKTRRIGWNVGVALICILYWFGWHSVEATRVLVQHGQTTKSYITAKRATGGGDDQTYTLDYSFHANGKSFTDSFSVDGYRYGATAVGSELTVTYLPADPETHREDGVTEADLINAESNWWIGGGAAALVVGLSLMCMEHSIVVRSHLLRTGIPAIGRVIKHRVVEVEDVKGYWLTYTYSSGRGCSELPIDVPVSRLNFERYPIGAQFTVLHDRQRPPECVPYFLVKEAEVEGAAKRGLV